MKKLSKKTKTALIVTAVVLLTLAAVIATFNIYFAVIGKQTQIGESVGYGWSADASNTDRRSQKLEMGDGDFKVLTLTDIHLGNHGTFAKELGVNFLLDGISDIALDKLVKKTDPDLIVVLGDTVNTDRNDLEYEKFVKNMDSYEIPWACVFGNHDDEGRADKAKLVDILKTSKYGLFEYGPSDLHGAGNYVIELTRNGKTDYAMFMMDSGSSKEFEAKTAGINDKQVEWYKWNMNCFQEEYGKKPANMSFFHIPTAAYETLTDNFEKGGRYENTTSEDSGDAVLQAMLENNGTHVFVGHDHNNNFIASYNGLKLSYVTKSSYNCYYKSGLTGGTLLTINSENSVTEEIVLF